MDNLLKLCNEFYKLATKKQLQKEFPWSHEEKQRKELAKKQQKFTQEERKKYLEESKKLLDSLKKPEPK